jgi:hypothetical protein
MNHLNNFSGQRVDSREQNDNAPPRYSAPSAYFKGILAGYANPYCSRCRGTGYIGGFKHVCAGRCFKCITENVWEHAQEEFDQTCEVRTGCDEMDDIYRAVCGDDDGGPAYLSDGMWITPNQLLLSNDIPRWVPTGASARRVALRSARWTA